MYNKKVSIVIDLDDTICFPNHKYNDTNRKYKEAKPNDIMISGLKKLNDYGYKIIIYSARRMLTHNGDIELIKKDIEKVTIDWLEKYNVPYDELIFGKPYSTTFYVDDKSMNIKDFYKFINKEEYKEWI